MFRKLINKVISFESFQVTTLQGSNYETNKIISKCPENVYPQNYNFYILEL